MPFWDERFAAIAKEYPYIRTDQYHIEILTANFVLHPDWFDVVVGSNLFGDILSDLAPAIAGTIGIAASSNINPERKYPSMFEPVHGSAPDIAGSIMKAIEIVLKEKVAHTPDMGGKASTKECGDAVVDVLKDLLK